MQGRGVRYHIKHAGQFLYKISNEEDVDRFKLTKIQMPSQLSTPRLKLEATKVPDPYGDSALAKFDHGVSFSRMGKSSEIQPVSDFIGER